MKAPARDGTEIFDAEGKAQIGKVEQAAAAAATPVQQPFHLLSRSIVCRKHAL